jgi:putative ABC transport system permease protein
MRDLKFALVGLRREPTFALAAILTLAIGVATVTTTFSVADAELWKPLPYPNPEQLVAIVSRGPGARAQVDPISGADLVDWRAGTSAFSDLTAVGRTTRRVLRLETAESALVSEVTANYFSTLGRRAVAGRLFVAEDSQFARVAVLTDRAWRRLFASDPSTVGRQLFLDDQPIVICGIVGADDSLGQEVDLYLPIDESTPGFHDRKTGLAYGVIGRLRPGASADVARAQLQAIADRIAQTYPEGRTGHSISVSDLRTYFSGNNWRPLYFFLSGSIVVLVLGAVNVAALLLGRAVRRTREFALRGALGGTLSALSRQFLAESAVIAIPAGIVGVLVSSWALKLFAREVPADLLLRGATIPIDFRVLLFTLAVSTLTTMAFVMVPLLLARRIDLMAALGAAGRTGASAGEGRARAALLTVQIALTVVLLSGAGLFLKSFVALTRVPLGFDPVNAIAIHATLSGPRYATDAQLRQYAAELVDRIRATPGVRDAALASSSPLGSGPLIRFVAADRPRPSANDSPRAIIRAVTPTYFRTLATRISRGREFSDTDVTGAPRVVIVNEYLAGLVFPGEDPIGKTIDFLPGARAPWTNRPGEARIVGVATNIKEVGINEVEFADLYVPFAQFPAPRIELIARTSVPASTLITPLRQQAASLDPTIPVTSATTFDARVSDALQGDRFNLLLTCAFAAAAVLLAAIGIYGAVAYAVQARTREFGVRLALGARPSLLVGSALWQAARIGVVGGAVGVGLMLVLAGLVGDALYLVPGSHNGLLFNVTTTDPAMLACAFAGIVGVALLAGAMPARRIGSVDPVKALREM